MLQPKPFSRCVGSFDPETLDKLGRAYDLPSPICMTGDGPIPVRDLIADRIMLSARKGERDVHALCRMALRGIALPY